MDYELSGAGAGAGARGTAGNINFGLFAKLEKLKILHSKLWIPNIIWQGVAKLTISNYKWDDFDYNLSPERQRGSIVYFSAQWCNVYRNWYVLK